jgi:hypothetical protein
MLTFFMPNYCGILLSALTINNLWHTLFLFCLVTYGHVTSGLGVFVDKEMDRHEVWMKVGGASQGMDVAAVFYPEHNGYTVVRVVHGT